MTIAVDLGRKATKQTGVIPISLFLLVTKTVLRKAAVDRGVRLSTGRYGCQYRGVIGAVKAYALPYTHAIELFQETMCYLSDKLFRVCDNINYRFFRKIQFS